ncbi:hypothetical protein [Truepera radiovictrix]|uniref:Uncharacterized protein n=1 Tax=Truepera radiovictrix (strain DSM 17093 / CIP 108686 / LMG 22925 / RQ-24) TaxID=649638 RepID=D7CY18_TRURR|nr:hypothetical protein [Truepera radiovictrix]ADI13378.1 conserved hypothetical protein [Truepera radiovictrix DSM 17093]WMT58059.1 hypothetical protein RCV51_03695 [Truepera radiovictrix]
MSKELIESFLQGMRERHAEEIEAIELPEGTEAYLENRIQAGDVATLTFMIKLAYLMGLHTGYAAGAGGSGTTPPPPQRGPLQA